jgi:hypothetical protein
MSAVRPWPGLDGDHLTRLSEFGDRVRRFVTQQSLPVIGDRHAMLGSSIVNAVVTINPLSSYL